MAAETPVATNAIALKVTQAAFVVRLFSIAAALVASWGRTIDAAALTGCLIVGLTSYAGLSRPDLLHQVTRHPSIALLDTALISVATAVGGPISPFVLAVITTALLIGLWVDLVGGLIVIVTLMAVYMVGLSAQISAADDQLVTAVVIPFVYLMLWYLGLSLRRALTQFGRSEALVRDAVATAAAAQERVAVARQVHDSVAKTLQGLMLATTSLPVYLQRDPDRALELARQVNEMSTAAVHELRQIMGDLRSSATATPLGEAVTSLVLQWQARTGRTAKLEIDPDLDTRSEAVRYELLSVTQEALDNVHHHAGVADVRVTLAQQDDAYVLTIADDGKGADPLAVERAADAGHLGVKGIHERMARIGGRANWHSAPGEGTRITCTVQRQGLVEA